MTGLLCPSSNEFLLQAITRQLLSGQQAVVYLADDDAGAERLHEARQAQCDKSTRWAER